MARSWRNFFRKSTDEEQAKGPAVASEPAPEVVEAGNGHQPAVPEPDEDFVADVPTAEEVQAERKEPAPEDVWEVDEPAPAEGTLPEPTPVEAEPDAEAAAEAQESAGWFVR